MRHPAAWLASFLFLLTAALLSYRVGWLGYPLFPSAPGRTWEILIEAEVRPAPDSKEAVFTLALPHERPGQMIIEERISSGRFQFNTFREGFNRAGIWRGPVDAGGERISYRAIIFVRPGKAGAPHFPNLEETPFLLETEEQEVPAGLVKDWIRLPPYNRIRAVAKFWTARDEEEGRRLQDQYGRMPALLMLLRAARLPAREVEGFRLSEGIRNRPLKWLEVWTGEKWEPLNPETAEVEPRPLSLLPLAAGGFPTVHPGGGEISQVRWTLNREVVSQWRLHFERMSRSDRLLDEWSLFRLPPQYQQTFRILLLVPVGTLVIAVLRNIVGFPTFGIFMPVLMALAFRNTGLEYGLAIFAGVLLIGYAARRGVDRLRLLLVPRMSVMVTLVIFCFVVIALMGNKLGVHQFMAVGLLPFVILTMVIERFFVLVEEAGAREGFKTAAGSAAVSVVGYALISWEPLQLTFFVFPELLAGVAACQILLGRYTGYRLTELFRFRDLGGPS